MKRVIGILALVAVVTALLWIVRERRLDGAFSTSPASHFTGTGEALGRPVQKFTTVESAPVAAGSVAILEQIDREYVKIVHAVLPSVVNITTARRVQGGQGLEGLGELMPFMTPSPDSRKRRGKAGPGPREESVGSGVILSKEGHIVTNGHVVEDVEEITVQLADKRRLKARVVGVDEPTDLAIIQVQADNLQPIAWGDSSKIDVGEQVLAIGNPFGLSESVSHGIVSAKGRNPDLGANNYEDFLQTNAAVNPGNSGGALVNIRGELVGINTAIASTSRGFQGISFAIPSNLVRFVTENLLAKGKVVRGYLGVAIEPLKPELQEVLGISTPQGAVVSDVVAGSPADKAGLRRRDVIVKFQGRQVQDPAQLRLEVSQLPIGTPVELGVVRANQEKTFRLVVAQLPMAAKSDARTSAEENAPTGTHGADADLPAALRGIALEDLTPLMTKRLEFPSDARGVLVTSVEDGSPAEGRLMPGDLIEEILPQGGSEPIAVTDLKSFRAAARKVRGRQGVTLAVRSGDRGVRLVALLPSGK